MTRRTVTIPAPNRDANARLAAAAADLVHAANHTTVALQRIARRIVDADDERTGTRGGGGGSGTPDPTFAAALPGIDGRRDDIQARLDRERLRDAIHAVEDQARNLRNLATRLAGVTGPAATLCDGRGYEGWEIPWRPHSRDEHNGWSDPTCRQGAGRSRLCPACLKRANRWRDSRGLERLDDTEHWAA